jgi:nitroreductase
LEALDCILNRRSATALVGPPPTDAELDLILQAGASAPDHRVLRPWRFIVIRGDNRAIFARALAGALAELEPEVDSEALRRQEAKAGRAPLLVVLIAKIRPNHRTPRWEQFASAAAAGQNICLAAKALGYDAAWRSTRLAGASSLRQVLDMQPEDDLLGWIEIGHQTPDKQPPPRPPLDLEGLASELTPEGLMPWRRGDRDTKPRPQPLSLGGKASLGIANLADGRCG